MFERKNSAAPLQKLNTVRDPNGENNKKLNNIFLQNDQKRKSKKIEMPNQEPV